MEQKSGNAVEWRLETRVWVQLAAATVPQLTLPGGDGGEVAGVKTGDNNNCPVS